MNRPAPHGPVSINAVSINPVSTDPVSTDPASTNPVLHLYLSTTARPPRDAFGRAASPSGLALLRDASRRAAGPDTRPARDGGGRWHWPGSVWRGSVSHAGPRGLAAVAEGAWIGVDLQDERPRPAALGWLAGVLGQPPERVTLRHWAETEALLKATGVAGVRPRRMDLPAWREGWRETPCGWWLWSGPAGADHVAVAAEHPLPMQWSETQRTEGEESHP